MMSAQEDFRTCPHCGRKTRHSIVRERVLAPVLWCLSCYHARVGDEGADTVHPAPPEGGGRDFRLAG